MAKTIAATPRRKPPRSLSGRRVKRSEKGPPAAAEAPRDKLQDVKQKGKIAHENGKQSSKEAKKLLNSREQPILTPEMKKPAMTSGKNAKNRPNQRKSRAKVVKSSPVPKGWGKAGKTPGSAPPKAKVTSRSRKPAKTTSGAGTSIGIGGTGTDVREAHYSAPLLASGVAQDARKSDKVSAPLLAWYDRHRRVLPWRALPGEAADPYKVWLSEIMLQQTTVAAVGPYFQRFVARWPTVADLAATPIEDLLAAWAGLGYYARARNLHACAVVIVRDHGGTFPDTEEGLRALPGIGAYTAGAISAIAFDRRAAAVDGNVERVTARLFAVREQLPIAKPKLRAFADALVPAKRAGDFAQAMMDLGATICTPRKPACVLCPLSASCEARRLGIAETLPVPAAKKARPTRRALAFWIEREGEGSEIEVLLRRRPPKGLLGGMLEIPGSDWKSDASADDHVARAQAPLQPSRKPSADGWQVLPGIVRHGFTHFELETVVLAARVAKGTPAPTAAQWWPRRRLDEAGLPTVMWKVVKHIAERE